MPGLYGHKKNGENHCELSAMKEALVEGRPYTYDTPFEDRYITASKAHINIVGQQTSPTSQNTIHIWIEGECYNLAQCAQKHDLKSQRFDDLLLEAYAAKKLDNVLANIDGYFCALLYDAEEKKILLLTDRLGMRPLYYYKKDNNFAWASEIKQLLTLSECDKTIDKTTAPCFMQLGFLLEDHTWFEHIKLTHPSSIYEYDISSNQLNHRYYWKWSAIKQQDLSFESARDALCDLLPKAVEKRFNPNEKIGISLSGGLDSRFLFACANELYKDYKGYAYTFGRPESKDVQIAKKVVALGHWDYEVLDLNQQDWFNARKPMVWRTEGMLSMMHMHGGEFMETISSKIDIALNGYAGDVVVGGGYITTNNANTRINVQSAEPFYQKQTSLADLQNNFYDTPHAEPHLYMNRVRRFTNMGTINYLPFINHRKPFMDNNLMEFMFSIDDRYKQGNRLYAAALLKRYPRYFKTIPWQKTGQTIDKPMGSKLKKRIIGRIKRNLSQFKLIKFTAEYTDYDRWVREKSVADQLKTILEPSGSEYSKIMPNENFKRDLLDPHLNNKFVSRPDKILRAATVELYLQKVFR